MNTSTPTSPATVLVVDDYPELCRVAAMFLEHCGFHVLLATGPEEAKKIAREAGAIDVLLTDVEMPGMRGDELAEWFRLTRPGTAVVFMSGNPMQERRLKPRYFVEKPFVRLDQLLNAVRSAAAESHAPDQPTSAAA
jgi:CheY-like chemotaxis protein